MPRDSKMSRMLHVLIHMDLHFGRLTSAKAAEMIKTNPVMVRRMMSGFRKKGYVTSITGPGGGWELRKKLDSITLFDVYEAIGSPSLFSIGPHSEKPECLVEQAVDARIRQAFEEAEALLLKRFRSITVADLADDFEERLKTVGLALEDIK